MAPRSWTAPVTSYVATRTLRRSSRGSGLPSPSRPAAQSPPSFSLHCKTPSNIVSKVRATTHPDGQKTEQGLAVTSNGAEVFSLTRRLVRFRSYTPGVARSAIDFIHGWFEARGLEAIRYKGAGPDGELTCLVVRVGSGEPRILLHGHTDVVPGEERQFEPYEENGELYGRGVYDMKGALAAMMYAVEDLDTLGCDATVEFLAVPDEEQEHGGPTRAEVLITNGHVGDFLITGEPTDFHIGTQSKGVLDVRVTLRGKSAHGSQPWLGKNAVLLAYEHYHKVTGLPFTEQRSEFFPYPSVNLARIIGGDVLNRVPDRCTYDLDIRYLPNQDPEELVRQIRSVDL